MQLATLVIVVVTGLANSLCSLMYVSVECSHELNPSHSINSLQLQDKKKRGQFLFRFVSVSIPGFITCPINIDCSYFKQMLAFHSPHYCSYPHSMLKGQLVDHELPSIIILIVFTGTANTTSVSIVVEGGYGGLILCKH